MLHIFRLLFLFAGPGFAKKHLPPCRRVVHDDLARLRHPDIAGTGILDAEDRHRQRGLHLGFFKGEIRVDHAAVDKSQTLAVAERLGADDGAVFKAHVLTVPGQIFAFDHAVLDDHVFCVMP